MLNAGSVPAAASVKNCVDRARRLPGFVRDDGREQQPRSASDRCSSSFHVMPCALSRSKIVPFGGGGRGRRSDVGRRRCPTAVPPCRNRRFGIRLRRGPSRTSGRRAGTSSRARSRRAGRCSVPVAHRDRRRCRCARSRRCGRRRTGCGWRSRSGSASSWSWHVRRHVERAHRLAVRRRGWRRVGRPVGVEREAVAAAEHAEVVVVGVVLHHQHDDVLDLRERVGARGQLAGSAASRVLAAGSGRCWASATALRSTGLVGPAFGLPEPLLPHAAAPIARRPPASRPRRVVPKPDDPVLTQAA